ncbi:MAG: transposase, partial [Eggerthellaceae bacterium]|nr:transposase [Eggerthellaceae bacterium]
MPKGNYRIEPLRERKLRAQVRDLEERLAALSVDPSAKREIAHLEGVVASLEDTVARLESEAIDQHVRYARLKERHSEAQSRSRDAQAAQKAAEHAAKDAQRAINVLQKRADDAAAGRLRLLEENRAQAARIGELEAELARKQAFIEHLNARLSRGPENSSIPPSAEPNRKRIPNSRTRSGRRPGGQLGHRGHRRKGRFPDAEVILEPENTCCPRCGCETCATGATRTHTVTDIELITKTTAYISSERACPHCGKTSWDAFPKGVENEANYGPGVKSAIAYLVGACNVSGTNARDFLKQMSAGEVDVSAGSVANFMAQFSRLSEGDRRAVFDAVATSPVIGSDATFTRAEGASSYVYVFHAGDAAVFSANRTKGHAAIKGSPLEAAPDATLVHDHDTSY